jgi:hypothetical protein
VRCGQAVRGTLARLNDTSSAGSSNRTERRSRVFRPRGRVRCCSQLLSVIGFTRQSARHATTAPTCPRRSRCAPNLSTNRIRKRAA